MEVRTIFEKITLDPAMARLVKEKSELIKHMAHNFGNDTCLLNFGDHSMGPRIISIIRHLTEGLDLILDMETLYAAEYMQCDSILKLCADEGIKFESDLDETYCDMQTELFECRLKPDSKHNVAWKDADFQCHKFSAHRMSRVAFQEYCIQLTKSLLTFGDHNHVAFNAWQRRLRYQEPYNDSEEMRGVLRRAEESIKRDITAEMRILIQNGFIIAGGYTSRHVFSDACYAKYEPAMASSPDVDFFIVNKSEEEAIRMIRASLLEIAMLHRERQNGMFVVRSPYSITVACDDLLQNLQIVLCRYDSVDQLLAFFDIDACRSAFDGADLITSRTFLRCLATGTVVVDWRFDSPSFRSRLCKYARIGLCVHMDGIRKYPTPYTKRIFDFEHDLMNSLLVGEAVEKTQNADDQLPRDNSYIGTIYHETERYAYALEREHEEDEDDELHWGTPVPDTVADVIDPNSLLYKEWPAKYQRIIRNGYPEEVKVKEAISMWKNQCRRKQHDHFWRFNAAMHYIDRIARVSPVNEYEYVHENNVYGPMRKQLVDATRKDPNCMIRLSNIVFQTVDCHPVLGAWNSSNTQLVNVSSSDGPLPFLKYIEDASYVLRRQNRKLLSRFISVPHCSDFPFSRINLPDFSCASDDEND